MEMTDSQMIVEFAILTSCLFIAVLAWAWIDTKQEQQLINAVDKEPRTPNKRHSA